MSVSISKQHRLVRPQSSTGTECSGCRHEAYIGVFSFMTLCGLVQPFLFILIFQPSELASTLYTLIALAFAIAAGVVILPGRLRSADEKARRIGPHIHK